MWVFDEGMDGQESNTRVYPLSNRTSSCRRAKIGKQHAETMICCSSQRRLRVKSVGVTMGFLRICAQKKKCSAESKEHGVTQSCEEEEAASAKINVVVAGEYSSSVSFVLTSAVLTVIFRPLHVTFNVLGTDRRARVGESTHKVPIFEVQRANPLRVAVHQILLGGTGFAGRTRHFDYEKENKNNYDRTPTLRAHSMSSWLNYAT